jgi:ribosomal protein S12 methylthiotransferase
MAAQKKISRAANRRLVGREVDVLLEGPTQDSEMVWQARMAGQAPDIDGVCYVGDFGEGAPAPGQIRKMRITKAYEYDLVGDLVDTAPAERPSPVNPFPIIAASAGRPRQHQ